MSNLKMNFIVDKDNNKLRVEREFDAELSLVWKAWTTSEILDQWWAPKPWKTETQYMDFREGGYWLYIMAGPKGEKHYCRNDYNKIVQYQYYKGIDSFCDENGKINESLPRASWENTFTDLDSKTLVVVETTYDSQEQLEMVLKMGMKEGLKMALENLDQFIETRFMLRYRNKTNEERVATYLNFPGHTEEAFEFYKKVFKSEFIGGIQRFGEVPPSPDHPPVADSLKNMILHIELPIIGNHILMGTDAPKEMGFEVKIGNNMHINLEPTSKEEADRIFNELSVDGIIEMPMQDMFWGAYFGSFQDKYGINWMINYQK